MSGVNGLKYEITPIGTVMKADILETILEAVKVTHEALAAKGVLLVEYTLRVDDRMDKPRAMKYKVDAVRRYMKQL